VCSVRGVCQGVCQGQSRRDSVTARYIRIKTSSKLTKFYLNNKKNNKLLTIAIKYFKTRYRVINRKNTK
jgi:hypothetical protein